MLRLLRSVLCFALLLVLLSACAGGGGERTQPIIGWKPTNWPQGASVRALAVHPQRPEVLFAGLNGQGVFLSTDDGRTWQPRNAGLSNSTEGEVDPSDPALRVRALLISRSNPDRLLAGSDGGVFETTDGGQSWQQQIAPETWEIRLRTRFARTQALTSAMTGAGEVFYLGTDAGLFVLRPGSETWQPTTLTGLQPEDAAWAVWVDPANPETVYAGTAGKGVWVSGDGGETWTAMNEGLEGAAALTINRLAMDGDGRLLAGTWGDGIYRRQDGRWLPVDDGLPPGGHVWSLLFDPENNYLYTGMRNGQTYFRSGDDPWQPASLGWGAWTLVQDEYTGSLFAGGNFANGAARSGDGGRTWEQLGLQGSTSVQALLFASGSLFAGTTSSGLYATTDSGTNWERRSDGFSAAADQVWALAASLQDPAALFAGTLGDGVYQSTDAGHTWASLAAESLQHPDPDVEADTAKQIISLAVLPWQGHERLFAGTQSAGLFMCDLDPVAPALESVWVFSNGLAVQAGLGATVTSLVVGPDGFLYAAVQGAGIFRSKDGGEGWEVVSREALFGKELAAAPRTGLQTWFHGPDRLYARTFDGLFGSSDGLGWQRLISGEFGAIAADLVHPQVAYMGVMSTTLASMAVTPTYASLVSLNNGRAWQEAGPISSPITVLAYDPDHEGILFAGTTDGVYRGQVHYPLLWREIAAWIVLLAPLLFVFGLVAYAYLALARPYGLSLAAALNLLLLRRRDLALVLAEPTALSPLEQLILIEADRPPWPPETIVAALSGRQAHANSAQIAAALNRLTNPLELLARDPDGRYRLVAAAVSKILARRTQSEAPRLARSVREENTVYLEAREFFRRSGLAVLTRGDTLLLQPSAPAAPPGLEPYAGADAVFVARLVANRRPGAEDVEATAAAVASEYNQQVRDRLAFLVVVEPPEATVYRRIADIRAASGLSIVLISHAAIHRALADGSISVALQMALRRARGDLNAGLLAGPIFDPLDFFDRADWLAHLAGEVSAGKALVLAGPPQVGKSSLAWQAIQTLTDPIVGYARAGSRGLGDGALGRDLLEVLLVDGAQKYPQIEWPGSAEVAAHTGATETDSLDALMQQIDALVEALRSQTATPRLALVIDDLADDQRGLWDKWRSALAQRPHTALLGILAGRGSSQWRPHSLVLPFTLAETEMAASILAAQAGATLASESLIEAFHQQSGGHPLLLRQLFGLALAQVRAGGESGVRLNSSHVLSAVEQHIRISPIYGQWWQTWSDAERQVLLALAGGAMPEASLEPAVSALAEWRWIERTEGHARIAANALAAWLRWAILLTPNA